MYFKFTILLISFNLNGNRVLGTQDVQRELTDNEALDDVYAFLKTWWELQPDQNITMNQFFEFVGISDIHTHLVNGYFILYPSDRLIVSQDNINTHIFRYLIRQICIGTGRDPIRFTEVLVSKLRRIRRVTLREITNDRNLNHAYEEMKKYFEIHPNNNITMDHFYAFVGPSADHINVINGYFMLYPSERLSQDNIDVALFKRLIRAICNETYENPVHFTKRLLYAIRCTLN
ncbi:uncharacterized protein LOC126846414 [Adelges cooleyi]|uniref:uncharacterized protein LOC126846414 n=1 Tax=Adelges cooleyi TaxID=133065 RepID=UPI00218037FF|nr:uncharacterized protein LOC126846414 [Adelges cooleyi]XP_050441753.1 uncharacterized protein LOC126846414 [Adelges cooleyi]